MHDLLRLPIHMIGLDVAHMSGKEMKEGMGFSAFLNFWSLHSIKTTGLGDFDNFRNRCLVRALTIKSVHKITVKCGEIIIMIICCEGIVQGIICFELQKPHLSQG